MLKDLLKIWTNFLEYVKKVSLLLTFFLFLINLIYIVYFQFFCYNPERVVISCLALFTALYSNINLSGGV